MLRYVTVAAVLVSMLRVPTLAATPLRCTPEQETAYDPFRADILAAGCDETTFRTCSDSCLLGYQFDLENSPDCLSLKGGRVYKTYREEAEKRVKRCEEMRANTTNKYMPQVVPGVRECDYFGVAKKFKYDDDTYRTCFSYANKSCSDECLQTIEDKIATAPFCYSFSAYTLGEEAKEYLVTCLQLRNEDLASNVVLNTVVTSREQVRSAAGTTVSTATAVVGLLAVVLFVV